MGGRELLGSFRLNQDFMCYIDGTFFLGHGGGGDDEQINIPSFILVCPFFYIPILLLKGTGYSDS